VFLLAGGFVAVVVGARSVLRERHVLGRIAGVGAILFMVLFAVSVVSPAVAATNVPATEVTRTPDMLGLHYESVTLQSADGVELAAWFLPGDNEAGVAMLHGAGSTRSSIVDQAAALTERGYSVLLIDARGHGESDGVAMDFGWFGDLDIAAGVEFLASRPEVDVDRIGVVGFSMGAEEAIGAAASDARIRAVVAEGATARQASDKVWLSEVYGWRGWLQERLEAAQYGITDFLSDASPPTPLRTAVTESPGTGFLLITAGDVEDEWHAASHIRSAANDRVVVWNVAGAGHTNGYATQPDEWTRRVVDFLHQSLD
jgi:dienelactone hydrolase